MAPVILVLAVALVASAAALLGLRTRDVRRLEHRAPDLQRAGEYDDADPAAAARRSGGLAAWSRADF